MPRQSLASIGAILLGLVFLPAAASAQSGIAGVARDTSGGLLPGVTVEASSPVLIEKIRTVVTDEQGRYSIVDLRPGAYRVTFTLTGFATFVRDGIELPSNFTATVNADLKVGAIEETVTVSGRSPVVDVQNAQRTVVLKRDLLDVLPQGRTPQQEGAMVVGVKPSLYAAGGARTRTQQRLTVHGSPDVDSTVEVDGMKMNTALSGGATHQIPNEFLTQEVVVQTSALGADVSAGGVRMNLVPREGGNRFSGLGYVGYSNGSMQDNNLTPALIARGLNQGDSVDYVYDVNFGQGGPLKRDTLWFFAAYRNLGNANVVANTFYPDGRPGLYDQSLVSYSLRLTAQLSPRNKLTAYYDRPFKNVPHDVTSGQDIVTGAKRGVDVLYYQGMIKWTSTVSNKLVLDASWGAVANYINFLYQPGIRQVRGSAAWYATVSHQDLVFGTTTTAGTPETTDYPLKYLLNSSVSYVTGSHAFKTGVQWGYGPYRRETDANGDLTQRYRSGAPDSVTVYNTPTRLSQRLNADLGFHAQDSWTLKRLTISPGIRFEYFNTSIEAIEILPGRFAPFRSFPAVPDIPSWFNVAPRFNAVYDLMGDAKTAIKLGVNKFNRNDTLTFAARYDPASQVSDTRNWSDLNKDDIAQENEIGPSNNANFGGPPSRRPDLNIKRQYNIQYSVGVERQLFSNVSVSGTWYRRQNYNLEAQLNTFVTAADYTAFDTPSPFNGEPVTIYNLNRAKQGLVDLVDVTSTDRSKSRLTYNGLEVSVSARLRTGGTVIGGWSADKTVTVNCAGYDPNTFRYCDQSTLDIPFRHDFKIVAAQPLPLGVQVGTVLQSYAGGPLAVNWAVPASVYPGGQRTQSVSVNLIPPGSKYLSRVTQLDLSLRKSIKLRRVQVDAALEMYNAINTNVVLNENQNFGSSLGTPMEIFQPRLLRISTNLRF